MKLSVITVCRNAENCLEETIRSVTGQTYQDIEYIVIDGESTDNTLQIIKKYRDKIAYFVSEKDNGVYDAMNKAIKVATGDVLFFLNAGDTFLHENVANIIMSKHFKKDSKLLYGDVLCVDKQRGRSFIKKQDSVSKMYFMDDSICHQSIFFKAEMFDKYGLFNTDYKIVADSDWLIRVYHQDKSAFKHINLLISIYTLGGFSWSPENARERKKIIEIYFSNFEKNLYKYVLRKTSKNSFLNKAITRTIK